MIFIVVMSIAAVAVTVAVHRRERQRAAHDRPSGPAGANGTPRFGATAPVVVADPGPDGSTSPSSVRVLLNRHRTSAHIYRRDHRA